MRTIPDKRLPNVAGPAGQAAQHSGGLLHPLLDKTY